MRCSGCRWTGCESYLRRDVVWGLLGAAGLLAGTLAGVFGVGSRVVVAVWGKLGGDWLVLVLECVGWV